MDRPRTIHEHPHPDAGFHWEYWWEACTRCWWAQVYTDDGDAYEDPLSASTYVGIQRAMLCQGRIDPAGPGGRLEQRADMMTDNGRDDWVAAGCPD